MATKENEKVAEDREEDILADVTVVVEGEDEKKVEDKTETREEKPEKKEDEKTERRAKDDDDEVEEEKDDDKLSPEEREKLREKRREERKLRKQRSKEREESREREIASLKATVESLSARQEQGERRATSSDFNRIEAGIAEAARQMSEAKAVMAQAVKDQNGEALAEAQEAWYEAKSRGEYLQRLKHGIVAQSQQKKPQVDPAVMSHAQTWMGKNTWYDPKGSNEDSRIALAIDETLAQEGWNPRTAEYWKEFDKRIAKRLPHRVTQASADDEEDDDSGTSSQTSGSGRERASSNGKQTYRLSADRVRAMKEAGLWDDPKDRARQIKAYIEYDKAQAERSSK